jgi:hypothetical protein
MILFYSYYPFYFIEDVLQRLFASVFAQDLYILQITVLIYTLKTIFHSKFFNFFLGISTELFSSFCASSYLITIAKHQLSESEA